MSERSAVPGTWVLDITAVTLLALAVRVGMAQAVPFPPADDPAYYVTVARNLHAGRGFVTDVIWQYQSPPAAITHPAGDLWMPLPSLLMALAFALAGPTWPAAQVPGILAGAGLAALAYVAGRQVIQGQPRERQLAVFGAVLVALNGVLAYQSASADSSALFCVLAAGGMLLASRAPAVDSGSWTGGWGSWLRAGRSVAAPAGAGVLLGLAYMARSDALFVVAGLSAAMLVSRRKKQARLAALVRLGVMGAAALAVAAPWLLRNVLVFGSPTPVPAGLLASLTQYEELFNYADQWSPGAAPDFSQAVALRAGALWHNWRQVLDFLFFPTALLPVIGLWPVRARPGVTAALAALAVTLAATALIFPVPAMAGTFYHDAGAFAPWLAAGLAVLLARMMRAIAERRRWKRDLLGLALAMFLVVTVAQLVLTAATVSAQHRAEAKRLGEAAARLAGLPPGPVISTSPYNLNYLTGRPGLMLPVLQPVEVVRSLAGRYGARVLVVIGRYGLYPEVLGSAPACAPGAAAAPAFCLLSIDGDLQIFYLP